MPPRTRSPYAQMPLELRNHPFDTPIKVSLAIRVVIMHADYKKEDRMRTVDFKIAVCALKSSARAAFSLGLALALNAAAIKAAALAAAASEGPSAVAPFTPIAAPKDRPYAGEILLNV